MSRAEEQALKAYPPELVYTSMISVATNSKTDVNAEKRAIYLNGYNQAEQDLMNKAKQWFTDNIPSQKLQLLWCDFELFIAEN